MVGEQSDWGVDPGVSSSCSAGKKDLRTTVYYGIWAGAQQRSVSSAFCGYSSVSTMTMRWPIGTKQRQNYNDGMGPWGGWNRPIQSTHGGAYMLRCDGAVTLFSDTTTWNVLMWMSIRDDGQAVNDPST